MIKQHPKTTKRSLICERLGTSHDIKSFAIGSFLDCFLMKFTPKILGKIPRNRPIFFHAFVHENSAKLDF